MISIQLMNSSFSSRYSSYRDSTYPYNYSKEYWNLVAARLAFVVVFQFVVYSITGFIAWVVPDVPEDLQFKDEREKQVVKEKLGTTSDDEDDSEEEKVEDNAVSDRPVLMSDLG